MTVISLAVASAPTAWRLMTERETQVLRDTDTGPHIECRIARVWQDRVAETLLALAVLLLAATGIDPLVLRAYGVITKFESPYDPVIVVLVAVPGAIALLVLAGMGLKAHARRSTSLVRPSGDLAPIASRSATVKPDSESYSVSPIASIAEPESRAGSRPIHHL
jgi:hypothetical protein